MNFVIIVITWNYYTLVPKMTDDVGRQKGDIKIIEVEPICEKLNGI